MDRKQENIENLYEEFQREINSLEKRRDDINRKIREIDADQDLLDDIYTKMRWMFKEIGEHCDEEQFLIELEWREDNFYDSQRRIESELEEEKEVLEREKRNSYGREEEIRDEFQRVKNNILHS